MFNDCIIMAGGSGTRLWPASSSWIPKQFLPLPVKTGKGSFLNASIDRAMEVTEQKENGRIIIITGRSQIANIVKTCEKYSNDEKRRIVLIPEPEAKNTAPAVACALSFIDWMNGGDRKVLVLTSDHIISPMNKFVVDAAAAEAFAQADRLAIFGIKPQRAETGYGYIEAGRILSQEAEDPKVYQVVSFREKPDREKAEEFIASGNFYWNSGMFAFSSKSMIEEFNRNAPDIIFPFRKLRAPDERSFKTERGLRILWEWMDLEKTYKEVPSISFDYAIAEKYPNTIMVSAGFDWNDVGSWDEYAALIEKNELNQSEVYQTGSNGCFVDSDIPVALIGVDDLIIAVRSGKNDGLGSVLIARKGETQRVREIVEQIKEKDRTELL